MGRGGAMQGQSQSLPRNCFHLVPVLCGPRNAITCRTRPPDLSPGAAHDLEIVIDEADNGEQTLVVVVEAAAEHHGADNVGHRAAHHNRGVEGLA